MTWYLLSVSILWVIVGTLAWLSHRDEGLQDNLHFHLLGAIPILACIANALVAAAALGSQGGGFVGIFGSTLIYLPAPLLGAVLGAPFLARAFALTLTSGARGVMGDARLVVARTYDQGEALEKRHRWVEAIEFYRAILVNEPDDREARRRIAEIEIRRGETERAVTEFGVLVVTAADPEESMVPLLRMVDLLLEMREPDRARRALREFLDRCDDPKRTEIVRRRLEKLGG